MSFQYLVCDLPRIPFEQYRESDNLVARLNLPNMRYSDEKRVDVYADAMRGLVTLERDERKQRKYIDFIDIYANLNEDELNRFRNRYLGEVASMSGLVQALKEEGLEQGIEQGKLQGIEQGKLQGIEQGKLQGIEQGMQKGESAMLIRQMERKFGPLEDRTRCKVESADVDTLLEWSERILEARSIEEIIPE